MRRPAPLSKTRLLMVASLYLFLAFVAHATGKREPAPIPAADSIPHAPLSGEARAPRAHVAGGDSRSRRLEK